MDKKTNLKKLMEAANVPVKYISDKSGISYRATQYYISGERQPQGKYLTRLADALDVPVEALLDDDACDKACKELLSMSHAKKRGGVVKSLPLIGAASALAASGFGMMMGTLFPLIPAFVAENWLKNNNRKESQKELFKELARVKGIIVELREKLDKKSEEYAYLALKTQQEDADVDECKQFFKINHQIELLQEYREILKKKAYEISLLIEECEKHPTDNNEMLARIVNDITDLEEIEKRLSSSFMDPENKA